MSVSRLRRRERVPMVVRRAGELEGGGAPSTRAGDEATRWRAA